MYIFVCNPDIPHTLAISTQVNAAAAAAAILRSAPYNYYYRLAEPTVATKSTNNSHKSSSYNVCNGKKVNSTLTTLLTTLRFAVVAKWQFICQGMR